jgi:hypothetical protein
MAWNGRQAGRWIIRAATVLVLVSLSVRSLGSSSASDEVAWWLFFVSLGVGLVGMVVGAAAWWSARRRASASADVADEHGGRPGHPGDHDDGGGAPGSSQLPGEGLGLDR